MIGKTVKKTLEPMYLVEGVVRSEYVVQGRIVFLVEVAHGQLHEWVAGQCAVVDSSARSRLPRKCDGCGKPFIEQSDPTATLCPGCRSADVYSRAYARCPDCEERLPFVGSHLCKTPTEPCVECGNNYPRRDLLGPNGWLYCTDCRKRKDAP